MLSTTIVRGITMKWEVKLYVVAKLFTEEVYASNRDHARETATARNLGQK